MSVLHVLEICCTTSTLSEGRCSCSSSSCRQLGMDSTMPVLVIGNFTPSVSRQYDVIALVIKRDSHNCCRRSLRRSMPLSLHLRSRPYDTSGSHAWGLYAQLRLLIGSESVVTYLNFSAGLASGDTANKANSTPRKS